MSSQDIESARVLVVNADPIVSDSISESLRRHGLDCVTAFSSDEALAALSQAAQPRGPSESAQPFHVVLADVNLSGNRGGLELLKSIHTDHPDVAVVLITAYGTIQSAVNAIKRGAFDYLTHPIVEEELVVVVGKAARHAVLHARHSNLRDRLDERFGLGNIVGHDARMTRIYELIESVAPTKTTVLMTGESGTGKSLVAKAIHQLSAVSEGPFVEISCGSIPETLLESELFGHVKGAFTGAHADKTGRFLAADGGTMFLDEINSASAGMQLKLLRVLQERQFEPVGSTSTVQVDVRVLLASNEPLEHLVSAGRFRHDLYYRINVVSIDLPSLRDRVGDIALLASHFLEKYNLEHDRHVAGFTDEALAVLKRYRFPGNVRELENIVERAVVLSRTGMIDVGDLPQDVASNSASIRLHSDDAMRAASSGDLSWDGEPLSDALEHHERRVLLAALDANGWNRQQTSDQLGINRTTLYKKIKQYGLDELNRAG